jgi:hypothetical protein
MKITAKPARLPTAAQHKRIHEMIDERVSERRSDWMEQHPHPGQNTCSSLLLAGRDFPIFASNAYDLLAKRLSNTPEYLLTAPLLKLARKHITGFRSLDRDDKEWRKARDEFEAHLQARAQEFKDWLLFVPVTYAALRMSVKAL